MWDAARAARARAKGKCNEYPFCPQVVSPLVVRVVGSEPRARTRCRLSGHYGSLLRLTRFALNVLPAVSYSRLIRNNVIHLATDYLVFSSPNTRAKGKQAHSSSGGRPGHPKAAQATLNFKHSMSWLGNANKIGTEAAREQLSGRKSNSTRRQHQKTIAILGKQ